MVKVTIPAPAGSYDSVHIEVTHREADDLDVSATGVLFVRKSGYSTAVVVAAYAPQSWVSAVVGRN